MASLGNRVDQTQSKEGSRIALRDRDGERADGQRLPAHGGVARQQCRANLLNLRHRPAIGGICRGAATTWPADGSEASMLSSGGAFTCVMKSDPATWIVGIPAGESAWLRHES